MCCTKLYFSELYCTVLYFSVLYCSIIYCTICRRTCSRTWTRTRLQPWGWVQAEDQSTYVYLVAKLLYKRIRLPDYSVSFFHGQMHRKVSLSYWFRLRVRNTKIYVFYIISRFRKCLNQPLRFISESSYKKSTKLIFKLN